MRRYRLGGQYLVQPLRQSWLAISTTLIVHYDLSPAFHFLYQCMTFSNQLTQATSVIRSRVLSMRQVD